jgi:hypothetical protein
MFLPEDKVLLMEAQKVFDELRLIGFRWGEIINAIGSPEPLLINRNDSRLRDKDPSLVQVIEERSDEAFQHCRDRLPVTYDGTREPEKMLLWHSCCRNDL